MHTSCCRKKSAETLSVGVLMPALCRYADRLRTWLQIVPPPLPLLTDLDRAQDGTLDLRQYSFSGRFMSSKLEAAYETYTRSVWQPRLRSFSVFLFVMDAFLLIKGLLCRCGLRFDTYDGWALVYAFAFMMSSLFFLWLLLSPRFTQVIDRMMPWLIPFTVFLDLIGYTVPLGLYLDHARASNFSLPEDVAAMQLMQLSLFDQGAWFTSSIMTFTLMTSLASVTFGVGAFAISLLMPVAIICYLLFERKRVMHQYGIEPMLVPQSLVVYALCTILTFCHTGSTRQQFLVRIYVQHERDLRVEQLEQEKERLDYERRFALRSTDGAPRDGSANGQDGHGTGSAKDRWQSTSEPELDSLGAALPQLGVSPSRGSPSAFPHAGCSSRSRCLMPGRGSPAQRGHARELSDADDEAMSHEFAPSVASDSTCTSDSTFKAGSFVSEERNQALSRTLDSLGIELPLASIRYGSMDRHHRMEDTPSTRTRNLPAVPPLEEAASAV